MLDEKNDAVLRNLTPGASDDAERVDTGKPKAKVTPKKINGTHKKAVPKNIYIGMQRGVRYEEKDKNLVLGTLRKHLVPDGKKFIARRNTFKIILEVHGITPPTVKKWAKEKGIVLS